MASWNIRAFRVPKPGVARLQFVQQFLHFSFKFVVSAARRTWSLLADASAFQSAPFIARIEVLACDEFAILAHRFFRVLEVQGSLDIQSNWRPAVAGQNECSPIVGWDFLSIFCKQVQLGISEG